MQKKTDTIDLNAIQEYNSIIKRYTWDDSKYITAERARPQSKHYSKFTVRPPGFLTLNDLRETEPASYVEPKNNRISFNDLISKYYYIPGRGPVFDNAIAEWGHVSRRGYEEARRDPAKMSPLYLMVACLYFYVDVEDAKEMFCICVGTDPLSSRRDTKKLGRAIELFLTDPDYRDDRSTDEAYIKFVKTTAGAYAYDDNVSLPPFLSRNPFWKQCYLETKEYIEKHLK